MAAMKIKKGDTVTVLTGKSRGVSGKVIRALPALHQVVVEGVNIVKKHARARRTNQKGQIIDKPMPIDVSNVALDGSHTKKAVSKKK